VFNICDSSGARVTGSVAAASYELAVDSANRALAIEADSSMVDGTADANSVLPLENIKSQELDYGC
jgi:hypothetical protein